MNYKPSRAGEVFAAFARLIEIIMYGCITVTIAAAIINVFNNHINI